MLPFDPRSVRALLSTSFAAALLTAAAPVSALSLPVPLATPTHTIESPADLWASARQSSGKLLVGGDVTRVNNQPHQLLVRYNLDGTIDPTWHAPTLFPGTTVYATVVDAQDRIYVGTSLNYDEVTQPSGVFRLLPDGQVDASFTPGVLGDVRSIALDEAHGAVYACGNFYVAYGQSHLGLVKLGVDNGGADDAAWVPSVEPVFNRCSLVLQGGALFIGGTFDTVDGTVMNNLAKIDASGSGLLDTAWLPQVYGPVPAIVHDPASGKLLVAYNPIQGGNTGRVVRISESGTGTNDFGWAPLNFTGSIASLSLDPLAGQLFIGGKFTTTGGTVVKGAARLDLGAPGNVSSSWLPQVDGSVRSAVPVPGGTLLLGNFKSIGAQANESIGRVGANGLADPQFQSWATRSGNSTTIVRVATDDASGVTYVLGRFTRFDGVPRPGTVRLVNDVLDPNWHGTAVNPFVNTTILALPGDAGLVASGAPAIEVNGQLLNTIKLDPVGGDIDPGFSVASPIGTINALAADATGIYAGGSFSVIGGVNRNRLAKLSPLTGAVDTDWNPNADGSVSSMTLVGGKLYVGGDFSTVGGANRGRLARLSTTGSGAADPTWDPSPGSGSVTRVAADPAGTSIYVAGTSLNFQGVARSPVIRIDVATAAPVPAFAMSTDAYVPLGVDLLADGHGGLLISGFVNFVDGLRRGNLARVSAATGGVDPLWDPSSERIDDDYLPVISRTGGIDVYGGYHTVGGVAGTGYARLPANVAYIDTVGGSPEPSPIGASYTVTVTVAASFATPTGSVRFDDGHGGVCVATLANGTASCTLPNTGAGTQSIAVSYQPDSDAFSGAEAVLQHTTLGDPVFGDGFE